MRGWFWWLASIAHWAVLHFNLNNFEPRDRQKVKRSIALVLAFSAIFFPTLIATTGIWGLVKFWLMPWLGYHFWMSTFTLVHHTVPEIHFASGADWNEAEAQLSGTLHCDYPRWVEVLCHDMNVHVPHHVSVGVPLPASVTSTGPRVATKPFSNCSDKGRIWPGLGFPNPMPLPKL